VPFKYRLDKVLKYRIQKRDEQIQEVIKAQHEVARIQAEIDKNVQAVIQLRKNIRTAHHTMLESYDKYILHLDEIIEQLKEEKQLAVERLLEEQEKLKEREKEVNVMEKHKEKAREQYKEEEKKAEMKRLDEVAGQKHFAKMRDRMEEELSEEERQMINEN